MDYRTKVASNRESRFPVYISMISSTAEPRTFQFASDALWLNTHANNIFPFFSDFSQLSAANAIENCRLAFNVAAKLGIPRVLDPAEVTSTSRAPDLLSMMTYLHQIRTHCCGRGLGLSDPSSVDSIARLPSAGADESGTKPLQESQPAEPRSVQNSPK